MWWIRCSLFLQMLCVAWLVCLSVCWSNGCTAQQVSVAADTRTTQCLVPTIWRWWECDRRWSPVGIAILDWLSQSRHWRLRILQSQDPSGITRFHWEYGIDHYNADRIVANTRDLTTPLLGMSCHPWASTCCRQPAYQIWSLSPLTMKIRKATKYRKCAGLVTQGHLKSTIR